MANLAVQEALGNAHIVQTIFNQSCVEIEDLCRFSMVNRTWRDVATEPDFWTEIDMSGRNASPGLLCRLLQRQSHVRILNAARVELTTAQLQEILPLLTQLQLLKLNKSNFATVDLALISTNLPQLVSLTLSGGVIETAPGAQHQPAIMAPMMQQPPLHHNPAIDLVEDELEQMLVHLPHAHHMPPPPPHPHPHHGQAQPVPHNATSLSHPTLRHLKFEGGSCMMLVLLLPSLVTLEIDRLNFRNLILKDVDALENIKIVGGLRSSEGDLKGLMRINRVGVVNPLPSLRTLTFESAAGLTDSTLERCSNGHPNITSLYLRDCNHCTGAGLGPNLPNIWSALHHLEVSNCEIMTGTALSRAIEAMRFLKSVVIKGCSQLTDLSINSKSIQSVVLVSPRTLLSMHLDTPSLSEFSLQSENSHMCAANALRSISISSWALSTLRIAGCPVLITLNLTCPNLRELELSECDSIGDNVISGLGNPIGLPELHSLTLVDCRALHFLSIESAILRQFKVSSCREMSYVRLGCKSLEHVCLEDCGALTTILIYSHVMAHLSLGSCPSLVNALLDLPALTSLDIKGCNQLENLDLRTPNLQSMNALMCPALTDDVIATLAFFQHLTDLQVGACTGVTPTGFTTLGGFQSLRRLDLAGLAQLEDPAPLIPMAINLTSLSLTDNFNIEPEALRAMLATVRQHSSTLAHINVSYCRLNPAAAAELAAGCRIPGSLAVNGIQCTKEELPLWAMLHGHYEAPSELRSLSLVQCKGLSAFYLGMVPHQMPNPHNNGIELNIGMGNLQGEYYSTPGGAFDQIPTPLSKLEDLQLRLGEFINVAISLPQLRSLDLGTCLGLKEVVLVCPSLIRLSLGACLGLTLDSIIAAVSGCPHLQYLDIGNCPVAAEEQTLEMIRAACPTIQHIDVTRRRIYV